jgi:hypothetical protein
LVPAYDNYTSRERRTPLKWTEHYKEHNAEYYGLVAKNQSQSKKALSNLLLFHLNDFEQVTQTFFFSLLLNGTTGKAVILSIWLTSQLKPQMVRFATECVLIIKIECILDAKTILIRL